MKPSVCAKLGADFPAGCRITSSSSSSPSHTLAIIPAAPQARIARAMASLMLQYSGLGLLITWPLDSPRPKIISCPSLSVMVDEISLGMDFAEDVFPLLKVQFLGMFDVGYCSPGHRLS